MQVFFFPLSRLLFFRFETRAGVTKAGAPLETDAFEWLEVFAELVGWVVEKTLPRFHKGQFFLQCLWI